MYSCGSFHTICGKTIAKSTNGLWGDYKMIIFLVQQLHGQLFPVYIKHLNLGKDYNDLLNN